MFTRRDFIQAMTTTVTGLLLGKELSQAWKDEKLHELYTTLHEHVHKISVDALVTDGTYEVPIHRDGHGIVYQGDFITANHVTDCSKVQMRTPFGNIDIPVTVKEQTVKLGDETLEKVCCEPLKDISVYKQSSKPDFPYKPCLEPYLGQGVVLIGDPHLKGFNVRSGSISSLTGHEANEGYIGTDICVIPGDSGCPIVSKQFQLIGLACYGWFNLSYATKIQNFTEAKQNGNK